MFQKIEQPADDKQIHKVLHPYLSQWFKETFTSFSEPQRYGILPIHNRQNTLIFAPTGTGKTLTAFTSIINELTHLSEKDELEDRVYCIYISPLKALSRDIRVNLQDPLKAIKQIAKKDGKEINIRVQTRTGDTKTSTKSRMLKKPPHILITTPESFAIVLTSKKFRDHLNKVDWVIVDEIHSLAANKRGVHLSLSLERLQHTTSFTRIGLSATVSPLDEVAKYLVGKEDGAFRPCSIVDAQFIKDMDFKVLSPVEDIISAGHEKTHQKMYQLINDLIQSHKTTLIFTNTRSATERVVHYLKDRFPKTYTEKLGKEDSRSLIGAHHGSLSANHRIRIEKQLKEGKLKCIVSSTSLELGIDIGYIDLVILLGSPKSVARALQRIGRSGHKLHETAKGRIIVMDRDDLVECAVLLKSAIEKKIDQVDIPKNCLDVLAQQIYGIAIEDVHHIDEVYDIVKRSYNYESLSRQDFDTVIGYLKGDYASLEDRHVYAKIWVDDETGNMGRRGRLARMIYMTNVGTIPDESYVTVKLGEEVIGKIDEGFLERLKRGDVFVLGGETYEFQYARGMTAVVKTSAGRPPTVPSWVSEMLPLSYDLAKDIQKFRRFMEEQFKAKRNKEEIVSFIDEYLYVDTYGANSIYEYFREQHMFSQIPHDKKIIIEHFSEDRKKYVVFHTLFGRRVNDVLSRAMAYGISKSQEQDVEIAISDNGFMLTYSGRLQAKNIFRSMKSSNIRNIMEHALYKTEVLRRRFRHCAGRGLMILRNYKGRHKSVGRQQVSSMLLLKAARRISRNFPILKEARREVLEDLMDIHHAQEVLRDVEDNNIYVAESFMAYPSPFSFHLVMQGFSDIFKIEDKMAFLKRMHQKVVKQIESPEKKEEFSYYEIWRLAQESREEEKQKELEELRKLASEVQKPWSQPILDMIDRKDVPQETLDDFKDSRDSLQLVLPEKLKSFVFDYIKEHDYQHVLLRQWKRAYKKEKFDEGIYYEGKAVIKGKRKYVSQMFVDWVDELLEGAVPYSYKNEIVKFLMKTRKSLA